MQHLVFQLDDKKSYKNAKKQAKKGSFHSILIQLFSGVNKKKKIKKVLEKLQKDFPNALIIGTTTAGEIAHATMIEDTFTISVTLFEKTTLKVHYTPEITKDSAKQLAQSLVKKDTKAMVIFGEGLRKYDYETFLNGIKEYAPKVIIAGGLAGDNFKLKRTYIFHNTNIYDQGAVAVSFASKTLIATNRYNLNWIPIGKEFTITKANHNVVYEIDDTPAVQFFKKYLGKEILDQQIQALPNFQLLFNEGSTHVARTPMVVDGDTLVFAAPIKEGQVVQFGFANEAIMIDGARALQKEVSKHPSEAIYIFSCIARKTLLGKTLQREFQALEKLAPTAGFFTYGEFYSTDANEALLNCTTTILVLSEKKKHVTIKNQQEQKPTLDSITFNALSHFIKQTSKELKTNIKLMNQYKEAVDTSLLVSKTNLQGYITYVNENFANISKYTPKELIGQNHNIVRDPSVPKTIFKKMWKTIESGKVYRGTFSNRAKDGSIYYVDVTVMPIFNENGKIEEYIALRKDITKQIKAKKRIQEKERFIRAIFDNQDNIVIHTSKSNGMQGVNKKLFEYFSFKSFEDFKLHHDCICDLFLDEEGLVTPQKYPNWLEMIAADPTKDYKVKMRIKTGNINTFTIKVKQISNEEYIISLYDITTLEQALQKAHSSERAKSTFLANMSHEIRTPLNGILGFTDILMQRDVDKEIKHYIEIIHKSGQTLLNIVNDVLDFSKLESGEFTLDITSVNLLKEMEATVATFASVSKQKRINYYTYIDPRIPKMVRCDVQRIKQVMNNLISNAIKFTPEYGEVTVMIKLLKLDEKQTSIHFSVRDSGIGIAPEKIASIFHPFSQADSSISRKFGGTGLGLSISNQYINMMGSHIEVESEVGKGSAFFFDLTLDVVDTSAHFANSSDQNDINISVLYSLEGIQCGIGDIVNTYLNGWNYTYNTIETLDEITSDTEILIVCAQVFDQEKCFDVLNRFPQLKLIYIEGAQTNFTCDHNRFYLIEQPMTGSSLFDILVSLTDPEFFTSAKEETTTYTTPTFNGNVLVAEDNETNQMLISVMLKDRGIEYEIVENGKEAVERLQTKSFDLVFMDINMPVMDGIQATKELRKSGYTHPIVSLSANVIESDTKAFKDAGMDDILHKPIVPQELDKILKKYLKPPRKQQQIEEFDTIDVDAISKALAIGDKGIIIELLHSLKSTLIDIEQKLQNKEIDKALLHRLKGAVGNMRLQKLYKLAGKYEDLIDNYSDDEKQTIALRFISHIQNAVKQINALQ